MEATKLVNRDVYEVTYENSTGSGTVSANFENPADGDVSTYKGADDGKFVVTVATGYAGEAAVTVTQDENDEVLDSGTVTFG